MKRFISAGVVALWAACVAPAWAGSPEPRPFDRETWARVSAAEEKTAVVFTSVHCAHCPGLISDLLERRTALGKAFSIVVVTTDGEPRDLLKRPYALADSLYVFAGNPQALRYAVNPAWRGETPYVALISAAGVSSFAGRPSEQRLAHWLLRH